MRTIQFFSDIENLPDDLLLRIFSFLGHDDLIRSVSRVSRRWNTISRAPSLWNCVNLSNLKMSNYSLKYLLRRKLIGPTTRALVLCLGHSPSIQTPLISIINSCPQLQRFCISHGRLESFWPIALALPRCLRTLKVNHLVVKHCDDHSLEFRQRSTNLNHLDLTGCGWFADRHLLRFLEGTSLTHLDLSHCYRLFGGPPVCSKLASRLKLLSERLSQLCPNLVHLGVCSVFTLTVEPGDESIQNQSLLTMIVESLPSLYSLNLSENTSLVEYVSWWIKAKNDSQILLPFFRTFIGSKMSRKGTTMELHLNRWPLTCTHAMLIAADALLTESTSSKFVLHFEHPFLLQELLTSPPKLVLQGSLRTAERKHSPPDKDPAFSTAKSSRLI
ncbi:F-box/LRR-repeat protein 12 [Clonorchis sinensis]|uniref:F-box/LRR-repeat protein 12 n=1 Tax=Clonorchis sinensis TaxID=79923 RepID=A0A8T1MQF9_CLOSI|nr:F-box/LRR-repeat protein 12 [Clonorchis sinensis]